MKTYKITMAAALLAGSVLGAAMPVAAANTPVSANALKAHANYRGVIDTMAQAIGRQYPIEATANKIVAALRRASEDKALLVLDEAEFIEQLNAVLWDAANDLHLRVRSEEAVESRTKAGGGNAVPLEPPALKPRCWMPRRGLLR